MRKALALLLIVFVVGVAIGVTMPSASAGPCYYKCICSRAYKCCVINGVETCKPVTGVIQCPQIAC
jgi:hypothetical protein